MLLDCVTYFTYIHKKLSLHAKNLLRHKLGVEVYSRKTLKLMHLRPCIYVGQKIFPWASPPDLKKKKGRGREGQWDGMGDEMGGKVKGRGGEGMGGKGRGRGKGNRKKGCRFQYWQLQRPHL
jgi:hypothetical protein